MDVGVDGPTSWDMLRGFTSVRADPLGFLVSAQERYGDLVAFPVPGPPVLLVNDPADVRRPKRPQRRPAHTSSSSAGRSRIHTAQLISTRANPKPRSSTGA
jgi:hypothetical protein